jgi:hypothetical protein
VDDLPHHLCPSTSRRWRRSPISNAPGSGVRSRRSSTAIGGRSDRAMNRTSESSARGWNKDNSMSPGCCPGVV